MRLDGKIALITGADRGMGKATVTRLLEEGARVVAADLGPTGLAGYEKDPRVAIVFGDVSVRADAERMIATAIDRFGRLDILVNNAGIVDRFMPVGEVTDEVWSHVLAVNLTGPMLLSRAAMPHLIASKGVIVNVASVGGLFGARAGAAYVASKHGLIGLTKNIATTYAKDGVRAVAVAPGGVNTGIPIGGDPSARGYAALEKTLATNPRMGDACEIASVIAFLASSDASFVNGEVLVADGGWTAY
jgi:NAD(P)-dependent dehydrogenase (short-subunit alcohol dehydrogenase family)